MRRLYDRHNKVEEEDPRVHGLVETKDRFIFHFGYTLAKELRE